MQCGHSPTDSDEVVTLVVQSVHLYSQSHSPIWPPAHPSGPVVHAASQAVK